jgi:hypothetical protein
LMDASMCTLYHKAKKASLRQRKETDKKLILLYRFLATDFTDYR